MNETSMRPADSESRRAFIQKAGTAAAVVAASGLATPVYGQNQAPSTGKVLGANDRIGVGYIGVGGQGQAHVRSMHRAAGENNIEQVAVCDVSKTRMEQARSIIGRNVPGHEDHRELLERKDVDAVCIATVDHWHTVTAIDAMESGRHVYVEKPMTRYLSEAFAIRDCVERTGKVLQVGSQGCSAGKYHKAAEIIRSGAIGPLVLGQTSYMRNNPKGEWNYKIHSWATPSDIDWDRWMGAVSKKIPFNADHYFRWRKYYPYCAGLPGDLLPHLVHPFMLATGSPEFPSRVVSLGSKAWKTDRNTQGTYERDVDESVQVIAEFPSGFSLMLASSTVNESGLTEKIRGHHGTLEMGSLSGTRINLNPERPFSDEIDAETYDDLLPKESIAEHEKNWLDCIRSGGTPNAGIDLAVKVQTVISLAEMSDRLNVMCLFDEKTRSVMTGDGKKLDVLDYGVAELS